MEKNKTANDIVNAKLDDRIPLNYLLIRSNSFEIVWALLLVQFYNGGIFTDKVWNPGMKLKIPVDIFLYHACYTIGITNKIA